MEMWFGRESLLSVQYFYRPQAETRRKKETLSSAKSNVKEKKKFVAWLKKMRCEHGEEKGIREWKEGNQAERNGGIMKGSENSAMVVAD
jgi:hypothetical protein